MKVEVLVCSISFLLPLTGSPQVNSRITPVVQVVQKASPAVVSIKSEIVVKYKNPFFDYDPFFGDFFERFFGPQPRYRKEESLGSGFFISPDGYILTNEHVIMKSARISVMMEKGERYKAKVVGADPEHDLAVLKVDAKGKKFPFLKLGDSKQLLIGETVIAIGNPFGLDHTVTVGVVSALHRTVQVGNRIYRDFIQTDASINPGNSGGPLLNIMGEVIGINTAIYKGAEGIGFAIPAHIAKRIVDDLIQEGHFVPAWTGLEIQDIEADVLGLGRGNEVVPVVSEVWKDSPAERAGIKPGDVILSVDGKQVSSRSQVLSYLRDFSAGDTIKLLLWRHGKERNVNLKTRKFPSNREGELIRKKLGVEVKSWKGKALVVIKVLRGGKLGQIGVRPGDLIAQIDGEDVRTPGELGRKLALSLNRDAVTLLLIRGGWGYYISVEM